MLDFAIKKISLELCHVLDCKVANIFAVAEKTDKIIRVMIVFERERVDKTLFLFFMAHRENWKT